MASANKKMRNTAISHRNTHLDGLRGLAAFIVVIAHGIITFDFALYTGQVKDSLVSWDVSISGAPLLLPMAGNLSVCVFFALSGYVLSQSFSNTSLGVIALLLKRYTRFTLPILSACLISYALLASGLMENHHLAAVSKSTWLADQMQQAPLLSQALQEGLYRALVQVAPFSTSYDSSLWTMPIELWGSVILIVVFSLTGLRTSCSKTRGRDRIFLLAVLGVLGCISYLGLFAFGALLNLTQAHRKVSSRVAAILLGAGIFLGTIPYSALPWSIVRPFVERILPTVPGIPYPHTSVSFYHSLGATLILMAANSWLPFRKILSSQLFRFLGQISFPLYLIHIPILMSVVCAGALAMLHGGLSYAWTMVLSLILFITVSLSVATALLFICESPSITLSGRVGQVADNFVRKVAALFRRRALSPAQEILGD